MEVVFVYKVQAGRDIRPAVLYSDLSVFHVFSCIFVAYVHKGGSIAAKAGVLDDVRTIYASGAFGGW